MRVLVSAVAISLLGAPCWALATGKESTYLLCRNDKQVRTVRVEVGRDGTCTTQYSKSGIEQTVASSRSKPVCVSVLNNIQANLQKANWNCKDISNSKIYKDDVET